MGNTVVFGKDTLDRMVAAVKAVHERLARAKTALERDQVPHAIVGGLAVGMWVSRVDGSAVRNTPDVDILLRRHDRSKAASAMANDGFITRQFAGIDVFAESLQAKERDCVRIHFAGEKARDKDSLAMPDVNESEVWKGFQLLSLDALVRSELLLFRLKNRVHLRDLIDVGLVDESWKSRFPRELGERLQSILDTPDG